MPDELQFTCPSCGKAWRPRVYANANGPFVRCPHCETVTTSDPNNAVTTAFFDRAARMDAIGVALPKDAPREVFGEVQPTARSTAEKVRSLSGLLSILLWVLLVLSFFAALVAFAIAMVQAHSAASDMVFTGTVNGQTIHFSEGGVPWSVVAVGLLGLGQALLIAVITAVAAMLISHGGEGLAILLEKSEAGAGDKRGA